MKMYEEYHAVETIFASRTDALCESVSPEMCDCDKCPARVMCEWLCKHNPYA